jgi:hypothetical protein
MNEFHRDVGMRRKLGDSPPAAKDGHDDGYSVAAVGHLRVAHRPSLVTFMKRRLIMGSRITIGTITTGYEDTLVIDRPLRLRNSARLGQHPACLAESN